MTLKATRFLLIAFGILLNYFTSAQVTPLSTSDTTRIIQIVRADVFREKKIDSLTKLQILARNVIVREGTTTFSTDSAVINRLLNNVEAFGSVHINESDSIHTYANYLKYIGNTRIAYLKKNVSLTDRKGKLTTQELVYDLSTGVGTYSNGGRITNKNTILTSREGTYISETKDVFFRKDVHLTDPKYDIRADSLQYNTLTEVVNFTGPTYIKSKDADIFTTTGYYDLKQGKAFFGSRPLITDSSGVRYTADNVALDEKTNTVQLENNAIIRDSVNGYTLLAGQIFSNTKEKTLLGTRKPVLIIQQEKDSTYITADTLFSGMRKRVIMKQPDTVRKNTPQLLTRDRVTDSLNKIKPAIGVKPIVSDTSTNVFPRLPDEQRDTVRISTDSMLVRVWPKMSESSRTDTLKYVIAAKPKNTAVTDTLTKPVVVNLSDTLHGTDSVRFFLAFAHVRIFNDSVQAVCDSLSWSGDDSVFRMYKDPVVWNGQSQLTGDTLFMFTKNKKAERLYLFENALIINKSAEGLFNQISGRTLNGYFVDGNIDYVRSKGAPAESVYYVQDDDSAYLGMNRASGSIIDMYFVNKELKKVLFVNDVKGVMHPIKQIPQDQKFLPGFDWLDRRRPKNKLELFE